MSKAGVSPRQIMSSLRQSNPDLQAISKNIYNEKYRIMKENLAGRTVIQALLEELGQAGFIYNIEYDQNGRLTHLMFAHPLSIALTKSYTNVFVMDCTYKTNKYKMPLLDIVGVTSFNTSFYSCFVFMQKEEEEDYVWALTMFSRILGVEVYPLVIITDRELALMNAINIVFPRTANILCVWHIEKNVVTNCKPHFTEEDDWVAFMSTWTALINSHDESSFNEAWTNFEAEYNKNVVMHFGNRATSRGEGAHSNLKRYLQVSSGGLGEVKERICLAIENQFHEIKARLSSEKIRHPHKVGIPFFKELITHISIFALDELHKQYELAKSNNLSSQCKGHFCRTMGLPCAHMIREMKFEALQLNSIHEQWRIDTRSFDHGASLDDGDEIGVLLSEFKFKYERMPLTQKDNTKRKLTQFLGASLPLLLEPNVQPHKGRPLGSKNKKESSSTKRDPSAFEIMEEKSRKCGHCQGGGHNIRTCPLKYKATRPSFGPATPAE
ncbi:protein FAR1-RELATED SEQUENCE 5-like [Rosa sericea]